MDTLSEHSSRLQVLDEAWQVVDVELSVDQQQVRILLRDNPKQAVCCPDCGEHRPLKDHAPVRSWRHLDTMQFETVLVTARPRTKCPQCGVKTCRVPWADPQGEFTLMFEAFAIRVLKRTASHMTLHVEFTVHQLGWLNPTSPTRNGNTVFSGATVGKLSLHLALDYFRGQLQVEFLEKDLLVIAGL